MMTMMIDLLCWGMKFWKVFLESVFGSIIFHCLSIGTFMIFGSLITTLNRILRLAYHSLLDIRKLIRDANIFETSHVEYSIWFEKIWDTHINLKVNIEKIVVMVFWCRTEYSSYGCVKQEKDLMCACLIALRCLHGFTIEV